MNAAESDLRAVHVVPGISEEASGPAYSVVRLCRGLVAEGVEVRLMTLDDGSPAQPESFIEMYPRRRVLTRLGFSSELRSRLSAAAEHADIMHNHSLWMMPNVYPGWATRGRRCRLVVSPRGTVSKWALGRSRWVKRAFWEFLQGPAVRHAACFHATADNEYEEIRAIGLRSQPVCVIPNGVDVPDLVDRPPLEKRTMLFLGRIHPKKGVDILLRAWQAVEPEFPEWQLHIVGPDNDGYLPRMQALKEELSLRRVAFRGPLYGEVKLRAYRDADLFVLPTHSENFGMTVAEALAAGTPAIVSRGAPWAGLEQHEAGWWIDIGVDALVACLEDAMAQSRQALMERGAAGRDWMIREYSWERVGKMMQLTYRWLVSGGETPAWVRLS